MTAHQEAFYEEFISDVYSVDGALAISEEQRQKSLALCNQANELAALA